MPRSMARLARPWATTGPLASSAALAIARSSTSPGGTTSSTRPMASASSAPTWRPVKMMSFARAGPTRRGRRWVPPPPGMMPRRISGWPNRARSDATRKSHARASSHPPPSATPLTAAIVARGMSATARQRPQEQVADHPGLVGPTELGDVGPGREHAVAAGHHHRTRRLVGERGRGAEELAQQLRGERVDLRVVEGHDGHAVTPALDGHERLIGAGHGRGPYRRPPIRPPTPPAALGEPPSAVLSRPWQPGQHLVGGGPRVEAARHHLGLDLVALAFRRAGCRHGGAAAA